MHNYMQLLIADFTVDNRILIHSNFTYCTHCLIALPGTPRDVKASELSAGSCRILVTWGPPTGSAESDIDRYLVYILLQDIADIAFSTTSVIDVPDCRNEVTNISVQAVNHFECKGQNSSPIQLSLSEIPTASGVITQNNSK